MFRNVIKYKLSAFGEPREALGEGAESPSNRHKVNCPGKKFKMKIADLDERNDCNYQLELGTIFKNR